MGWEPRLITPFEGGLSKYYKPWLIEKDAFADLEDAYSWRGSVRKREGYDLLGTLPTTPVQGLKNWINPSTLNANLIAFSTTKSYTFSSGSFTNITQLSDTTAFSFGNGVNDYFWASNYASSMWIANGLGYTTAGLPAAVNGILYLAGNGANSWNIHTPQVDGTPTYLNGALIVLPYKGRLVTLNTIEGDDTGATNTSFQNRARWSQIGTPYVPNYNNGTMTPGNTTPPAPFATDADAWRSDIPGKGGFIDADTSERIVSAGIVKDTLIVFFQRSTWRLRYTGNEILPFIWERLNTQYGAESTYSSIEFDEAVLTFSRFGWIGSSTQDVARIDLEIPDDCFAVEANNSTFVGLSRIQGIRDLYRNMAYWTFESIAQTSSNQIYAYNYLTKKWAIFNPTVAIRTWGLFYNTSDETWQTFSNAGSGTADPNSDRWVYFNSPNDTWSNYGSSQNNAFPFIVGGDVNGNVYQMFDFFEHPTSDNGTPFKFSILTKRFNPYIDTGNKARLGYVDLYCDSAPYGQITVNHFVDDQLSPVITKQVNLFSRGTLPISAVVLGNPTTITTVSPHGLNPANVQQVTIGQFVGSVGLVLNNQTFVATVTSATQFTIMADTNGYTYSSGGVLYSVDNSQADSKYYRIYLGAIGYMHQLQFTLSSNQLVDPNQSTAQFNMQGLVCWFRREGRIRG